MGISISECIVSGLSISSIPDISQKPNEEKVHSFCLSFLRPIEKGSPKKAGSLPAGGKVLTSEDEYNLLSDRHFPDPIGELLHSFLPKTKFLNMFCLVRPVLLKGEGGVISLSRDILAVSGDILVITT